MRRGGAFMRIAGGVLVTALVVATGTTTAAVQRQSSTAGTATVVRMKDDFFKPKTVTISKGTKIKWVNRGEAIHTTTSTKGLWDETVSPGESYTRTFRKARTFRYYCTFHEGMTGKIVVA